ncbi:sulfite exporter TauE/SafE family protein [Cognatishimia activa]|uniref:sulfite exporter TauE/SafE family protein n=1 Tax=Cognatishimia activa TaxID=1715691 RepID=UPI002231FA06|nr:sulfite exporter TauE/SafE family protein [Cognatishimia activa]UZD92447.1 sulfite exporter TauE/SafE family protein [Cognatishimia activa]
MTPDILTSVLATPGLVWLVLTISVAGIVRGFTGFGTALIFVPVANIFLPAADVIAITMLVGFGGSAALLPRALKVAEVKDVSILGGAAILTVPLGLWVMTQLPQDAIRWTAAVIAFAMLSALVLGWRYRGRIDMKRLLGIGAAGGAIGGMTGLTGPAVILFYLANGSRAEIVRANTILFLAMLDVVIVANMTIGGLITWQMVALGLFLAVPYFLTARVGQGMFDPKYEKTYRTMAYLVIALAVATGLPIWD